MPLAEQYFPPFRLDIENEQLWRGTRRIVLRPKAFAVLQCLVTHPGQLLSKATLFDMVWPATAVSDTVLKVCIRELRQALDDYYQAPRFIETVRGCGYRFIAELTSRQEVDDGGEASMHAVTLQHTSEPDLLVGREADIAVLLRYLDQALQGWRQVVCVTGEAGVGKTAVVNAFVTAACGVRELQIGRGQCIEHYGAGEAYMPILEALDQLCQTPGSKTLMAQLLQQAPTWMAQLPWLLSDTEQERLHKATQGATRERMLREMAHALEALSSRTPLILILEDLHWSDYSTLDLLTVLARRQAHARLLVLVTYRPEEVAGLGHPLHTLVQELHLHGYCEVCALPRLPQQAVRAYVGSRLAGAPWLDELAQSIHQRSEGNALFMVNMVDDMEAQGILRCLAEGKDPLAVRQAVALAVPENLRQMLDQRFDRLSADEQHVLEVGSVAGVEFAAALVAAGLQTSIELVEACCAGLTRRQQWLQSRGESVWPDGTISGRYGFVHALKQEVVYRRVTAARRLRLHRQLGERLEHAYGARAQDLAAELAMHFELAHDYRRALRYHQQAGENAIQRSAYREAIDHLHKGLDNLSNLPETPERLQHELALSMALGTSLIAIKGFAASEVESFYANARDLAQQVQDLPHLFTALRGLYICYGVRGPCTQALVLARQLLQLARRLPKVDYLLLAYYGLGQISFAGGDLSAARAYLEQGMALYDPRRHHALAFRYVVSPGVTIQAYYALTLWQLGYFAQAQRAQQQALALAREIAHPHNQAFAWIYAAGFYQRQQQPAMVQELAQAAMALATEQGFVHWLAHGRILHAWALIAQGQATAGITRMQQGLQAYRAMEAEVKLPYYLGLLAEAYGQVGEPATGYR
jgi:DNA-binding winged helix-turn-helix (wHTH) protein/tetratricopeptide (TPR) repeat protein